MRYCPHCRREIDLNDRPDSDPSDPVPPTLEYDTTRWTTVSRMANLAEVGYFTELLQASDIEANIQERDEFSAVDGSWRTSFILQVLPDQAQRASELIKEELMRSEEDPDSEDFENSSWSATDQHNTQLNLRPRQDLREVFPVADTAAGGSRAVWKSFALVLVAGGLAYTAGRSELFQNDHNSRSGREQTLWDALGRADTPLTSKDSLFRLRYDQRADRIDLDEDTNGDGQYDRHREYFKGRLKEPTRP